MGIDYPDKIETRQIKGIECKVTDHGGLNCKVYLCEVGQEFGEWFNIDPHMIGLSIGKEIRMPLNKKVEVLMQWHYRGCAEDDEDYYISKVLRVV